MVMFDNFIFVYSLQVITVISSKLTKRPYSNKNVEADGILTKVV